MGKWGKTLIGNGGGYSIYCANWLCVLRRMGQGVTIADGQIRKYRPFRERGLHQKVVEGKPGVEERAD